MQGHVGLLAVAPERAQPGAAMPQVAGHRRLHHAEHRHAVLDQRDVDGELAIALDELARAVQRIDHPQPRPGQALRGGDLVRRLLRQHRDVGGEPRQAIDNAVMRGEVGGGQRRVVGLVLHCEFAVVDAQDFRRGVARDRDHALAQFVGDAAGRAGHHRARNHSRTMNNAAMLRPSEKSSRSISSCSASSLHGTGSSSSGSSPGRRSGYRSRASTRCAAWLM